jgi:C4-dicarboxylate transporter DctM subunit
VNALNITLLVVDLLLAFVAYRARKVGLMVWVGLLVAVFALTSKTTFLVFGAIAASLLLGQPLFVLMGALGVLLLATVSGLGSLEDLTVVVRKLLELASKEVLLAVPFFVVAGELMTQGSLARRLVDVMKATFSWMPGGLAVSAVAGCVFFAAISGSSPVTVVAIGSIMVPALLKAKYPDNFSIGLLTTAGSLGILIPPSIPMIVYSIMVSSTTPVDPTDLFLAGIVPGLFIGTLLAGYSVFVGARENIPRVPFSFATWKSELARGFWSLLLPVIILGGIYGGIFTATEAAAVSVIYALVVELFLHKELTPRKLVDVAEQSMVVMGSLLVILALAITLNYFLVLEQIPDAMVEWLKAQDLSRNGFLILVNLLLLVVGCFMDIMSAILILAPMLAPMASAVGVDPIHMGIIFIVNLEIGYLTPPVGLNLFVSSTLFKRSLGFVIRAVVPTLIIMLVSLVVLTWVPAFSLGLVHALKNKPAATPTSTNAIEAPPSATTPPDGNASGKVKSLQELMRAAQGGGADAAVGDAGAGGDTATAPGRVKSLQELMEEAKQKAGDGTASDSAATDSAATDSAATPDEPKRVKSLQELMEEAKKRDMAGGAPAAP